jgi:hypothetical protein
MTFSRRFALFAGIFFCACLHAAASVPLAQDVAEPSFRNHIQPVLTKMGCNMGACHGAAAGKNGFVLSLRGYNDEPDFLAITRGVSGRRIVPSDPGRSLLLLKATGTVPHKGGKRFETGSPEYRLLADWIAAGAHGPKDTDAKMTRIEVLPAHTTLKLGGTQPLTVRAMFSDGRLEDVTRWAKFTAANAQVANVDDNGVVTVQGFGEGPVSAWYLSQMAVAFIASPFTNAVPARTFAKVPERNFIDRLVTAKLRELNLPPSPPATDAEFLRRAYLDTTGTLPTLEQVRAFLADKAANKRDAVIERLLGSPEFTDYWSYKWSDLLLVNSAKLPPRAARAYHAWIRRHVEAGTPWDAMVRELVTAQGSTLENGAGNFFILHDDPRLMAETTTQAFLGMSVGCAKCHNHPMEKWTNDDYYALANLFARVRSKNGAVDGERLLVAGDSGELVQPRTGKPQRPKPLDGKALDLDATGDRRTALADWLVSRDNPYFAKAIVNRVWANFFGIGLVERVDDLRVTNPASNEKLLAAAAGFLADQRFDLKTLMRAILQSSTYQRSSLALPGNAADTRFYSRYYPKRLMAEVILDAMSQVAGAPTEFKADAPPGQKRDDPYPVGFRALQLPDTFVQSYFLKNFGRPDRLQTCECERSGEPSVAQVLHLANGDTLNQKLRAADNSLARQCAAKRPAAGIVEDAYLAALGRFPTATEKEKLVAVLDQPDPKELRAAIEDLYWALLSSKEFLFNH